MHVAEVSIFEFSFDQEGCLNTFGSIGMNINEPSDDHVDDDDEDGIVPEVREPDSFSDDEPGHKKDSSNTEDVSSKSVVLHGRVGSNECWASFVDFFALSCSIAERNAGHVDVRISVSPDEIEEASAAAASIIACCSELRAACLRVADEEFDQKSRNFEESVQEGSTNNTAPVLAEESLVRIVASSFLGSHPVPVRSSSRNAEVD